MSLQHLVKNNCMAQASAESACCVLPVACAADVPLTMQAEAMRQLLCGLLQKVILGPGNCLRMVGTARRLGLPELYKAAAAVARHTFPLCALEDTEGLAAASEPLMRHLLQHADRQVLPQHLLPCP